MHLFFTDSWCVAQFSAPLDPNPTTDMERRINELRLKYRTYMVEIDVEYVSGLPTIWLHFIYKFTYCFLVYNNTKFEFVFFPGIYHVANDFHMILETRYINM